MIANPYKSGEMAAGLLQEARQQNNLAKLVMSGIAHVDSWLIEQRLLPSLQKEKFKLLRFVWQESEMRTAALAPLADGSAFALNSLGVWSALKRSETQQELEYIGARFAPGNRWCRGFVATLQAFGHEPQPVLPDEVVEFWRAITGLPLHGFEVGVLDHIEAIGLDAIDKVFHTQGRLGL